MIDNCGALTFDLEQSGPRSADSEGGDVTDILVPVPVLQVVHPQHSGVSVAVPEELVEVLSPVQPRVVSDLVGRDRLVVPEPLHPGVRQGHYVAVQVHRVSHKGLHRPGCVRPVELV